MSGIGGGAKCVKVLLFVFNFIFFLVGLLLVVAGAVIQTKFQDYVNVLGPKLSVAPFIIIGIGSVIFLVAFFGCCGAYKENVCMVQTFAGFLIVILLVEFAGAIACFVLQSKLLPIVSEALTDALQSYTKKSEYQIVIDKIQSEFECCGVNSSSDWNKVYKNNTLPQSCCPDDPKNPAKICTEITAYKKGCVDNFVNFAKSNVGIVAGIGLGVCFIEILGIVFACCLSNSIKSQYEAV